MAGNEIHPVWHGECTPHICRDVVFVLATQFRGTICGVSFAFFFFPTGSSFRAGMFMGCELAGGVPTLSEVTCVATNFPPDSEPKIAFQTLTASLEEVVVQYCSSRTKS